MFSQVLNLFCKLLYRPVFSGTGMIDDKGNGGAFSLVQRMIGNDSVLVAPQLQGAATLPLSSQYACALLICSLLSGVLLLPCVCVCVCVLLSVCLLFALKTKS